MEYRKLNEKEELKQNHKQERDGRVREGIKAVLMHDVSGMGLEEIAKVLLLSHEGVRKDLLDYHGSAKLKRQNGASHSQLTSFQEEKLVKHLETIMFTPVI